MALSFEVIVNACYTFGSKGHSTGAVDAPVRRSLLDAATPDMVATMENHLRARGATFESIEVFHEGGLSARHVDDEVYTTIRMLGVRDAASGSTVPMDHQLKMRHSDRTGVVDIRESQSATDRLLGKRHDGPGLKITYNARETQHNVDLAKAKLIYTPIADEYGRMVKAELGKKAPELIGEAHFGEGNELEFRIIPELDGFGLNYEDVEVCGPIN